MMEALKVRLDFQSPIIQVEAVRKLVAAVLREKSPTGHLSLSATQGSAAEALWERCCGDCAVVRSACCDAVALLVDQGHADPQQVLNGVLNLLPSARNAHGLVQVVGKLLRMQADRRDRDAGFTCPYGIRNSPHPYITALENRPDCWTAILAAIAEFVQQAVDRNEPAYVAMLVPFLRYLYCQPERRPEHGFLRQGLLRTLLPANAAGAPAPRNKEPEEDDGDSPAFDSLLRCLCRLVPHMPVDCVETVLELHCMIGALLPSLSVKRREPWRSERLRLLLQLLCACQRCLGFSGDCRPLVGLMAELVPTCRQELPFDELLIGVALLLFEAPAAQQSSLLSLVLTLVPEHTELSQWVSPVLVLPVLQLLSCSDLTEPLAERHTHDLNQKLAQRVLHGVTKQAAKPQQSDLPEALLLTPWFSEVRVTVSTLRQAVHHPSAAVDWLLSFTSAESSNQRLPCSLALMVTHLLLTGQDDVCRLALDAVRAIAAADPRQVPSLLPVLLFKLGKEKDPSLTHAVLDCLPNLGTHKFCVPAILQTLGTLASSLKLKAVAMRLTAALWKKEDRVYPELQRLLALPDNRVVMGRETQWEQVLARAACLRDICRERPYQHASDMLAAIALTLKQCSRGDQVTPAVLALQGLQELCRAEVVDIVSTWKSLGPELRCDSRPPMVKAVSQLLALVPQLAVKSEEYEKLKEEAVGFLWHYAVNKDPEVASCGFRALADFPEEVHTINHLPEAARPAVKPPEPAREDDDEEEEKDFSVAGSSYVKLLTLTPSPALAALELFLTSLIKQETSQMPRGVYFSALRGGGLRSDQGKTLAGIPAFMLKSYEKNKQPGLKAGLAAGLLLCYELPQQTDRAGRPLRRLLLSRSRSYQQTMTALIHEVNIQPSEWHRALLLPQAWRSFMNHTFHAVIEGRRADLETQLQKDQVDTEALQHDHHCAWLWARDHLTDTIRGATKESPVVQGNSILALSALAAAVAKYERNLPAENDAGVRAGPETVPTGSWLAMVLDTLLSIVSSGYKAKGQVFPWYLHRSYSGENTASAIARSCASLALSLLVPVPALWHRDGLKRVLSALRAGLPGSPAAADDSQAIRFHSGLALGAVLSAAHRRRLGDDPAQKDGDLLLDALAALEACSFDSNAEYNTGCVLGLALALSALCSGGPAQQRDGVVPTLDKLLSALQDSGGQGRMMQEVLAYSAACVSVSAFSAGVIDPDKAERVVATLRALTEESPQTPGLSMALGLAVHGLSLCGHGRAEDLRPRLLAAWLKILLAEGCPTMQRLAAVNGLVALVGSESYLIQLKSELELSSNEQSRLNEVLRAISQIVSFSGAIGLQSNCACLMGHLHLSHTFASHSHAAVPPDFGYLAEKSVIRAVVDLLTEAGKKGPEFAPPSVVQTALRPLASVGTAFQYPPVNWSGILSPLMRLGFGEEVQHQCVALAAAQAQYSQSASLFLGSWLSSPLVYSLSSQTRGLLYENLSSWMKHVPEDKLQFFVETLGPQSFREDLGARHLSLRGSLLRGLARAMAAPDPPGACWAALSSATEKIFDLLPNRIKDTEVDYYVGVADCLSEMSDTEIDRIAGVTETQMEKTCFVLSCLASRGRIPLLALNDVIAGVLRGWPSHRVGWILLQTFYQCRLAASVNTGVSKRMEWLLELMGLIRNVAYGAAADACGNTKQSTDFLFQVFAAAVVSWGDLSVPLLLGVRWRWFPWSTASKPAALAHALYGAESLTEGALPRCLLGLPRSLPPLLHKEPWNRHAHKFIEWLLSLVEGPEQSLSPATVDAARAALSALRSSPEFKKKSVWTRAYGWESNPQQAAGAFFGGPQNGDQGDGEEKCSKG